MNNSTNRNLLIIIAVLVLTNIAVLGYFLWFNKAANGQRQDRARNGISEQLQKEVGFSEEQLAQYKLLKDKQREIIHPIFEDMRKSKDSLFRLLSDPNISDSTLRIATETIAQKQQALDMETFHHFKRVRALCQPNQEAKYDSLILRMFRRMGRPRTEQEKKN